MFSSYTLLLLIFITLTVMDASTVGTSKAKLGFMTKINHDGNQALGIVEMDRTRLQAMIHRNRHGKRSTDPSVTATNSWFIDTVQVGVGSPPTYCRWTSHHFRCELNTTADTLIVDTGSANTWVGGDKNYVITSTSEDTGNFVVCRCFL